jgi:ABC-type transporter MlaC component
MSDEESEINPTNNGYKVTDLIVSGIRMASAQRSDLASVIQRNSGQVQALLAALRERMRATASSDNRPGFV